jgi:hypothetical protein
MAEKRPIAGLLAAFGANASGVSDSVRVFVGGPVEPAAGFVLHSAEYHRLACFAGIVALLFVMPDWADDIRDGRSSFGKATAGVPGSARKSCAETDVMNPAAKTAAIVIRRAKDGLWAIRRPLNVLWK